MINLALAGCMDGKTMVVFFHAHNYGVWFKEINGPLPVMEPEPNVKAKGMRGGLEAFNPGERLISTIDGN